MADQAEKQAKTNEKCRLTFTFSKNDSPCQAGMHNDTLQNAGATESLLKESRPYRKSPETLFANVPNKQADDISEGHVRDNAYEDLKKTHKGSFRLKCTLFLITKVVTSALAVVRIKL